MNTSSIPDKQGKYGAALRLRLISGMDGGGRLSERITYAWKGKDAMSRVTLL